MLYLTQIFYGRPRTAAENTQINDYLIDPTVASAHMMIGATTKDWGPATGDVYSDNITSAWSTEAAADGYLAIVNSFTPPPESAKKLS